MSRLTGGIHTHTPTLTVIDPRGLTVRSVAYCRSVETAEPEERINRSTYDAMGRLIEQWDPRLWALSAEDDETPANLVNRYSLSGKVLSSISVDAGRRVSLFGDGDQLVQAWDSRGSERRVEYDDLLRPLAIFEQGEGEAARCTERYEYADADVGFAAHNQCGQLIRHDDPAGTKTVDEYALTSGVLEQTQRFLSSLESPDWPPGLPARDTLLEPVAQAATSASYFNPLGDVLEQTDAKGNRQLFDYTVDGQLLASYLQLSDQPTTQTLVSAIRYSAYVQVEQETAGNGVVSTLTYRPEDGRLIRLQARHGTEAALQDLHYEYDPVGNVLSIEDATLPIRYFANQRVEPIKHYDYDSLYQLIDATGWETGSASRGPEFNRFDDPGAVANYHQTYHYDAGGNLLELVHVGPQSHSRKLTAARYSNRCLPEHNDRPPIEEEIAAAFDGNGNLLDLQPGQAMNWDLRNQLREVRPVEREGSDDDSELYLYGGDGMRRRKVRTTQTNARSLISEVRYLPGLETRTREGTGEVLQVICVQAGRSAMQVLHWETTPPSGITNDQYRYNLTDHLGSSSLELDSEGEVISQETYHPYGSTAWFAGRSEVEASYKTVRYSGKERDATGLYYYGFRYYAPWLQRWVSPDPVRDIDGLNLYRFVRNNPMGHIDPDGLDPTLPRDLRRSVEDARQRGIKLMESALETLQHDKSSDIGLVMDFFFDDSTPKARQQWIVDIQRTLNITKLLNIEDNASLSQAGLAVAEVDQRALEPFKRYVDAIYRIENSGVNEGQKRKDRGEKKKDYESILKTRFMNVNRDAWKETEARSDKYHMAVVIMHEMSHAALRTEDYTYARLLSDDLEKTLSPLRALPKNQLSGEDQLQAYKDSVGQYGEQSNHLKKLAYKNADSFANAIKYLAYSSKAKHAKDYSAFKRVAQKA
jgi:insecticidal toxin complex protein TccC